jgi:hypothetical protein
MLTKLLVISALFNIKPFLITVFYSYHFFYSTKKNAIVRSIFILSTFFQAKVLAAHSGLFSSGLLISLAE